MPTKSPVFVAVKDLFSAAVPLAVVVVDQSNKTHCEIIITVLRLFSCKIGYMVER